MIGNAVWLSSSVTAVEEMMITVDGMRAQCRDGKAVSMTSQGVQRAMAQNGKTAIKSRPSTFVYAVRFRHVFRVSNYLMARIYGIKDILWKQ